LQGKCPPVEGVIFSIQMEQSSIESILLKGRQHVLRVFFSINCFFSNIAFLLAICSAVGVGNGGNGGNGGGWGR